jgi:hypothetical protein
MTFKRHAKADERKASVVVLVKALLQPLPGIYEPHRRRFLSKALWLATLAEGRGKYKTRFISKAAYDAPKRPRQHEHVYQCSAMVKALIKNPGKVEEILEKAVGCVVTKDEHRALDDFKNYDGWDRYIQAGIEVIDMETGLKLDLPAEAALQARQ